MLIVVYILLQRVSQLLLLSIISRMKKIFDNIGRDDRVYIISDIGWGDRVLLDKLQSCNCSVLCVIKFGRCEGKM